MAITIFLVLNGLGVVFLLYVLEQFWKEGHRPTDTDRKYASDFGRRDWSQVVVVTHPVSHSAQGGLSVIPFRVRNRTLADAPDRGPADSQAMEIPTRRISTR
jgi:hypothetical protein